jgi:hypothetical protein
VALRHICVRMGGVHALDLAWKPDGPGGDREHDALGPFVFDRAEYEAALTRAEASIPGPSRR